LGKVILTLYAFLGDGPLRQFDDSVRHYS
jgi:hypothetical protein